jgi:hypothetical protein
MWPAEEADSALLRAIFQVVLQDVREEIYGLEGCRREIVPVSEGLSGPWSGLPPEAFRLRPPGSGEMLPVAGDAFHISPNPATAAPRSA